MNDIVTLDVHTAEIRTHRGVNAARLEVLGSNLPTSTMVEFLTLARPELLLKVNAIAVISRRNWSVQFADGREILDDGISRN